MLGRDHALLGAAAGVALAGPVAHLAGVDLPPVQIAAAGAIASAFALLPDIDEPGSTVSRKLGPLSETVSHVTNTLAGGHRQATHSILFAAGIGGLFWWLERFALTAPIVVFASLSLILAMIVPFRLGRRHHLLSFLAPVAAGWAVWRAETGAWLTKPGAVTDPHLWGWLWAAAAGGVLLHLIGDMVTVEGVPYLWPARLRVAVPILGHTESAREQLVGAGLSIAVVVLTWIDVLHPLIRTGTL